MAKFGKNRNQTGTDEKSDTRTKLTIEETMPTSTTKDDFKVEEKKRPGRKTVTQDRDNTVADVNIPSYFTKNEAKAIKSLADEDITSNSKIIRRIVVKYLKENGRL